MIVVSQDDTISVPYEYYMFKVADIVKLTQLDAEEVGEDLKKGLLFWLVCVDADGDYYVMGKYTSKVAAMNQFKKLYKAYHRGYRMIQLDEDAEPQETNWRKLDIAVCPEKKGVTLF